MTTPWESAGCVVDSGPQTLDEVWSSIGRIAFGSGAGTQWVFRGVADSNWRCRPSLIHQWDDQWGSLPTEDEARSVEQDLIGRAREWALGLQPSGSPQDFYLLALMQHHGIPTRLLDVTANPLTALWFASRPAGTGKKEADGVLIAFNVTGLKSYGVTTDVQTWNGRDPSASWRKALDESATSRAAFVVRPDIRDLRMTAQEGLFIASAVPESIERHRVPLDGIHANSNLSGQITQLLVRVPGGVVEGEQLPGLGVVACIVPARLKEELRSILDLTFNRSERTMFPDLDGLRNSLGGRLPAP